MKEFIFIVCLKLVGLVLAGIAALALIRLYRLDLGWSILVGLACGYLGSAAVNEFLGL